MSGSGCVWDWVGVYVSVGVCGCVGVSLYLSVGVCVCGCVGVSGCILADVVEVLYT